MLLAMKDNGSNVEKIVESIHKGELPQPLLNAIANAMMGQRSAELLLEQERFDAFNKAIQKAESTQELLNGFEKVIQFPLAFLHSKMGVTFSSEITHDAISQATMENLKALIDQDHFARIWQENAEHNDSAETDDGTDTSFLNLFEYPAGNQTYTIVPIETTKRSLSFFAILCSINQLPEWAAGFLHKNTNLILLTFLNLYDLERMKIRQDDHFTQQWLQGRYHSEADLYFAANSRNHELPKQDLYHVILVNVPSDAASGGSLIYPDELFMSARHCFSTHIDGELYIIDHHNEKEASQFPDFVRELYSSLLVTNHVERLSLLVSESGEPNSVPKFYRQVLRCKEIAHLRKLNQEIILCSDLRVELILHAVRDSEEANRFVKQILGPLIRYDKTRQTQFTYTLYAYLTHHSSTKDTAAFLYTHYNTVMYRLERIEEVLGYPIRTGEGQFMLRLAYELDLLSDHPLCADSEGFLR